MAVQKNLVIVGATGMVGGYALRYALDHPAVGRATTIGRRTVGISHPKLNEVIHQDYANCSALAEVLSDHDAAIFCRGAYTGAVSDTELRAMTVDYTIEFARVLHDSSPDAAFAFFERKWCGPDGTKSDVLCTLQGRGRERAAREGLFASVYIFRPAYIYPVTPRRELNFGYRLLRVIYPAFRVLSPNQVIRADDLARAMVDVAVREAGERRGLIFENRDIQAIVE
jgi:hypothetical protein